MQLTLGPWRETSDESQLNQVSENKIKVSGARKASSFASTIQKVV